MSGEVATMPNGNGSHLMDAVLAAGDLSRLTADQRNQYYMATCESLGLNPLTRPFEYIKLNNKLTLYALRTCTDQLRSIHGVSIVDMIESERDGVYIVTVKVKNKDDRTDMAKGAVTIANLKGDALANAMMKAETKAKRRATLSICGLGFLDETEVQDIPAARHPDPVSIPHDPVTGEIGLADSINEEQIVTLTNLIKETAIKSPERNLELFCQKFGIETLGELPANAFDRAIAALEAKKVKK